MIDLIIISDTGMPYNINKQRSLRSVFGRWYFTRYLRNVRITISAVF